MPNTMELIACPNPKCQKTIENLLILIDESSKPAEQYYACPHCHMKVDGISTHPQEQKDGKKMKGKGSSGCPHHFGYLAMQAQFRGEGFAIPEECLVCQKAMDCVLKTSELY